MTTLDLRRRVVTALTYAAAIALACSCASDARADSVTYATLANRASGTLSAIVRLVTWGGTPTSVVTKFVGS